MTNREIDALIQKHLFPWDEAICRGCGWRRIDVDGTPPEGAVGCDAFSCSQRPLRMPPADSPAAFSTDPAASKQLRDRMRADGWEYEITVRQGSQPFVIFERNLLDDSSTGKSARGATEELAVAIAALRALGVEVQA